MKTTEKDAVEAVRRFGRFQPTRAFLPLGLGLADWASAGASFLVARSPLRESRPPAGCAAGYPGGWTQQQIADCLSVPRRTVRDWLTAHGVANHTAIDGANGGNGTRGNGGSNHRPIALFACRYEEAPIAPEELVEQPGLQRNHDKNVDGCNDYDPLSHDTPRIGRHFLLSRGVAHVPECADIESREEMRMGEKLPAEEYERGSDDISRQNKQAAVHPPSLGNDRKRLPSACLLLRVHNQSLAH